jgi:hypothetical protein
MKSKRNKYLDFVIDDIFRQIRIVVKSDRWGEYFWVSSPWTLGEFRLDINDEYHTNDDVNYKVKTDIQRKLYSLGLEFKEFVTERYGLQGQTYYQIILWGLVTRITDEIYQ